MTHPAHPSLTMSATAMAQALRAGRFTAREVVDAHLARVAQVNPHLNAVVAFRTAAARAEADAADVRLRAGGDLPPLLGVPCTIKESFAVDGMPWTAGTRARQGVRATEDAPTVHRWREAGAIVLGVTNTSELCMWMESFNPVYGRTGNPYDPRRTAGGSSGGEGSIVGAGASPFGLGADVGGSIRMPAFFNGVWGHKPSPGLIPNRGQYPVTTTDEGALLLGTGPIARHVDDLRLLVRLLADDPAAVGDPATVDLHGMSVLDVPDNGIITPHHAIADAQSRVARALAARGARVTRGPIPAFRRTLDLWAAAMDKADTSSFRGKLGHPQRRTLLPHLARPAEFGGAVSLPAILLGLVEDVGGWTPGRTARNLAARDSLRAEVIDRIGDGVLLFPTYPEPAPRHGAPLRKPLHWTYTALFNALGLPVTQVPTGLDARGLPTGVQIVGPPGADHRTLAVALALHDAGVAGWIPPWTVGGTAVG